MSEQFGTAEQVIGFMEMQQPPFSTFEFMAWWRGDDVTVNAAIVERFRRYCADNPGSEPVAPQGGITLLQGGRPDDKAIAAAFRSELEAALGPVAAIITRARSEDFILSFQLGTDFAQRTVIQALNVSRNFP